MAKFRRSLLARVVPVDDAVINSKFNPVLVAGLAEFLEDVWKFAMLKRVFSWPIHFLTPTIETHSLVDNGSQSTSV